MKDTLLIIKMIGLTVKVALYKFLIGFMRKLKVIITFIIGFYIIRLVCNYSIHKIIFIEDIICMFLLALLLLLVSIGYIHINDYIVINRFTGTIEMNIFKSDKILKRGKGKESRLNNLTDGFVNGIILIPERTNKKVFKIYTHQAVFDKIMRKYNCYNNINFSIKDKKEIEKTKYLSVRIKYIFKKRMYTYLTKKTNKYKIILSREDIINAKNRIGPFALDNISQ